MDLGEGALVSRVTIHNRFDGTAEHASIVSARLSNSLVSLRNLEGNTLKSYRIIDATNVPVFDLKFDGYLGCYRDLYPDRDLPHFVGVFTVNGRNNCAQACFILGYLYAGTQFAQECWCGNSYNYGSAGVDLLNGCDMPCTGNAAEICGGVEYNSVYRTFPAPTYSALIESDFSTTPPNNAVLYGSAFISNGVCVLTPNLQGQWGALLFDSTVFAPTFFEAQWDYRAADGDGADGTSFSYGLLGPGGNDVEFYGLAGAALVVSFKEYLSHKWLSLRYNDTTIQTVRFTPTGDAYKRIHVKVGIFNSITVSMGGTVMISASLTGTNYATTDKSGWRFGFASRTGMNINTHSIDNFSITFTD